MSKINTQSVEEARQNLSEACDAIFSLLEQAQSSNMIIQRKDTMISSLTDQNTAALSENERLRKELDRLQSQVDKLQLNVQELALKNQQLQQSIDIERKTKISALNEIENLRNELNESSVKIAKQTRTINMWRKAFKNSEEVCSESDTEDKHDEDLLLCVD